MICPTSTAESENIGSWSGLGSMVLDSPRARGEGWGGGAATASPSRTAKALRNSLSFSLIFLLRAFQQQQLSP